MNLIINFFTLILATTNASAGIKVTDVKIQSVELNDKICEGGMNKFRAMHVAEFFQNVDIKPEGVGRLMKSESKNSELFGCKKACEKLFPPQ